MTGITLRSADGKLLRSAEGKASISLAGLPQAVYVVTAKTSHGVFTEKVLP